MSYYLISINLSKMKSTFNYIVNKFVSGIKGFYWLFKEESSIWFHFLVTIIVIVFGVIFKINNTEWLIILLTFGLVISIEMLNSALESMVDLVSFSYNVNAKKIKDISAAATLFTAITAVSIGLIIFIPYFINF